MKDILVTYTNYNLWANKKILDLLSENISLIDKEVKSSFPSLRKTIHHIWFAEEIWYKRLHGESLTSLAERTNDFAAFTKNLLARSQSFIDAVKNNDEKYLQTPNTYKAIVGTPFTNPQWEMIMHCMNHSTYHRGQIVTMLREFGVTTIPATDMIVYLREIKL